MTSGVVMTKTPFPRKNSSSMEEDEEDEDFDNIFSPPSQKASSSRRDTAATTTQANSNSARSELESPDKDQPIEIKKVVSNALPVVNKMSQQIYADHQSQAPAKGKLDIYQSFAFRLEASEYDSVCH